LDLREELKRHEDELKMLKSKWESIAAKDLITSRSNPINSINPLTSPSPLGRKPRPISTLTTPIDQSATVVVPDSVGAAKRWMGGLVKSAQAGVSGLLENLALPPEESSPVKDLETVKEEEEEDLDDRRVSSSSAEESSTFSEGVRSSSSISSIEPPKTNLIEEVNASVKHSRRRSTFDLLGQTANHWTGSIGKKWVEVRGSETFKSSKRVTLNFVDTFEKTITEAMAVEKDDVTPVLVQPSTFPSALPTPPPENHSSPSMDPLTSDRWSSPTTNLNILDEDDEVGQMVSHQPMVARGRHHKRMSLPVVKKVDFKDDEWAIW